RGTVVVDDQNIGQRDGSGVCYLDFVMDIARQQIGNGVVVALLEGVIGVLRANDVFVDRHRDDVVAAAATLNGDGLRIESGTRLFRVDGRYVVEQVILKIVRAVECGLIFGGRYVVRIGVGPGLTGLKDVIACNSAGFINCNAGPRRCWRAEIHVRT